MVAGSAVAVACSVWVGASGCSVGMGSAVLSSAGCSDAVAVDMEAAGSSAEVVDTSGSTASEGAACSSSVADTRGTSDEGMPDVGIELATLADLKAMSRDWALKSCEFTDGYGDTPTAEEAELRISCEDG